MMPTFLRIFISGGIGIVFVVLMNFVFGNFKIEYFFQGKKGKKPLLDKGAQRAAKAFSLPFLF